MVSRPTNFLCREDKVGRERDCEREGEREREEVRESERERGRERRVGERETGRGEDNNGDEGVALAS